MRTPYYAQQTNPRPFGEPVANFDFDLSFLDQPVSDLSMQMFATGMSRNLEANGPFGPMGMNVPGGEDELPFDAGDGAILPDIPQGRELVGGWFDPNDVPPGIRDHL